jgi:hypothetical protein
MDGWEGEGNVIRHFTKRAELPFEVLTFISNLDFRFHTRSVPIYASLSFIPFLSGFLLTSLDLNSYSFIL